MYLISAEAWLTRRAAWQPAPPNFDRGWLQIYRRNVGPLPQGAVLVRPDSPDGGAMR